MRASSIADGEPASCHTDDPHPVEPSDGPRFEIGAEGNNQVRLVSFEGRFDSYFAAAICSESHRKAEVDRVYRLAIYGSFHELPIFRNRNMSRGDTRLPNQAVPERRAACWTAVVDRCGHAATDSPTNRQRFR